jgi:DNA-binding IclR family transcriptional regulator
MHAKQPLAGIERPEQHDDAEEEPVDLEALEAEWREIVGQAHAVTFEEQEAQDIAVLEARIAALSEVLLDIKATLVAL